MKRDALVAFLKELGWAVDKYGHLQKTIGPKKYRVPLQAIVRFGGLTNEMGN